MALPVLLQPENNIYIISPSRDQNLSFSGEEDFLWFGKLTTSLFGGTLRQGSRHGESLSEGESPWRPTETGQASPEPSGPSTSLRAGAGELPQSESHDFVRGSRTQTGQPGASVERRLDRPTPSG